MTVSLSGVTTYTVSEVHCTTDVFSLSDDSTDKVYFSHTIVASGDFTVHSNGETLDEETVRAFRLGGKEVTTGSGALIIELQLTYDPDIDQGVSIAIQDTDSNTLYVLDPSDLSIRVALSPTGD